MSDTESKYDKFVTNAQLNEKIDKLRWELRCLILVALVLGPTGAHLVGGSVANAATSIF